MPVQVVASFEGKWDPPNIKDNPEDRFLQALTQVAEDDLHQRQIMCNPFARTHLSSVFNPPKGGSTIARPVDPSRVVDPAVSLVCGFSQTRLDIGRARRQKKKILRLRTTSRWGWTAAAARTWTSAAARWRTPGLRGAFAPQTWKPGPSSGEVRPFARGKSAKAASQVSESENGTGTMKRRPRGISSGSNWGGLDGRGGPIKEGWGKEGKSGGGNATA